MTQIYHRRDGVREQQVGADRMVFDEAGDCVHVLNSTAAFVWDCLKKPTTVPQIEQSLREEYDISRLADAIGSILRVLDELKQKGLIEVEAEQPTAKNGTGA